MFEGKASRPKWWSRPEGAGTPGAGFRAEAGGPGPVDPAPADPTPDPLAADRSPADQPPGYGEQPERSGQETVRLAAVPPEAAPPELSRPEPVSFAKGGGETPTAPQPMAPGETSELSGPGTGGDTLVSPVEPDPLATGPAPAPAPGPGPEGPPAPADGVPRHRPDPYGTPPYGRPGPYAPAPPFQHPHPHPHQQHPHPQSQPPLAQGRPHPQHQSPPQHPHQAPWHRPAPWGAPGGPAAQHPLPPPPRRRRTGRLLVGALLIALVAGVAGGAAGAAMRDSGGVSDVQLPQAPAEGGDRAPDSVAGIAAATLPGVVYIHVRGKEAEGTGTGFVLDAEGHILTNNHVVEPAADGGEISVTFNSGDVRSAEVVGGDGGYDLAVLKVEGVSGLQPLKLGNSDSVEVGDPVVAIGAPYDLEGTVTSGIISAKDRPITAGGGQTGSDVSYVNALQTDAPINPGNSGGPLVNARGEVIGINSAIRSAGGNPFGEEGQGGSIGLGFAIPINQGKRVAEELINTGEATHPVIGVQVDMRFSGDGAKVSEGSDDSTDPVTPGGPADDAGIEPGDVVKAVDGKAIHSGEELIVKIRSLRPGATMRLTVERDGDERQVDVTLGSASGD